MISPIRSRPLPCWQARTIRSPTFACIRRSPPLATVSPAFSVGTPDWRGRSSLASITKPSRLLSTARPSSARTQWPRFQSNGPVPHRLPHPTHDVEAKVLLGIDAQACESGVARRRGSQCASNRQDLALCGALHVRGRVKVPECDPQPGFMRAGILVSSMHGRYRARFHDLGDRLKACEFARSLASKEIGQILRMRDRVVGHGLNVVTGCVAGTCRSLQPRCAPSRKCGPAPRLAGGAVSRQQGRSAHQWSPPRRPGAPISWREESGASSFGSWRAADPTPQSDEWRILESPFSGQGDPVAHTGAGTATSAQGHDPDVRSSTQFPRGQKAAPVARHTLGSLALRCPRSRRPTDPAVRGTSWLPPKCWGYSWKMRPIRWIVGTSLVGLGAALLITRRELDEERQAHRETVLALETIKQVATPRSDS